MNATTETTLSQLGGFGRLRAMLGAYNVRGDAETLSFRFKARATNGANCVLVTLDAGDTYRVKLMRIGRNCDIATVGEFDGVYASELRSTIESATGLRLSL